MGLGLRDFGFRASGVGDCAEGGAGICSMWVVERRFPAAVCSAVQKRGVPKITVYVGSPDAILITVVT